VIVVDTTVLVYAVGADHALAAPCRELVRRVGDERLRATTTVEALQEFAHVRARRRGRPDAVELTRQYHTLFTPLLRIEPDDLDVGLDVFLGHDEVGAFDAVLAGATRRVGATALVTTDRGFAAVPGLRVLDPASPVFLEALDDVARQ